MIRFNADDHTYWDGERRVPSVSEVLKAAGLGPDYSAIDPDVLARAAARGVHVEQCCQLWSEGVLDETSVHPEAVGYLDAFKRFVQLEQVDTCAWQRIGFDPVCDVAGTCDLVTAIRDGLGVIDVKATSKIDRGYRLQVRAYRRMQDLTTAGYVLQLRRDGTYVLKDCDRWEREEGMNDEATWLAAVALYRWKQHGNGRK